MDNVEFQAPKKEPPEAMCPKCGREARDWPDIGVICPVCSHVADYIDAVMRAAERRMRGDNLPPI